jgi:hypothetical protein
MFSCIELKAYHLLFLILISTIGLRCTDASSVDSNEVKTITEFDFDADSVFILIPTNGCNSCIEKIIGASYGLNSEHIKVILTNIADRKFINKSFTKEFINRAYLDFENTFGKTVSFQSHLPRIHFLSSNRITTELNLSTNNIDEHIKNLYEYDSMFTSMH